MTMIYVTVATMLLLSVVGTFASTAAEDSIRRECYVCSSYMEQCKERVDVNKDYVHRTSCKTACFVRRGDDDALYRGCFDGFMKVEELKGLRSFDGCTNTTWSNRKLPWCLCSGDLCNAESMNTLQQQSSGKHVVNAGYAKESPAESYYHREENYEAPFQAETGYYNEADNSVHVQRQYDVEEEEEEEPYKEAAYQSQYQPVQYQEQQYQYREPQQQYQEPQYHEQQQQKKYQEPQYHVQQQQQYRVDEQYPEVAQQVDVNHAADPYYGSAAATGAGGYQAQYRLDDFVEHLKQGDEEEPDLYEEEPAAVAYDPYKQARNTAEYGVKNQVQEDYPPEEPYEDPAPTKAPTFPQHLAARIQCAKTGFYQNPDDCRTFVACILDPHYRMPYMHLMRCPDGLVWDNSDKICMEYSTTCNIGGSPVPPPQYPAAAEEDDVAAVAATARTGEYYAQQPAAAAAAGAVEAAYSQQSAEYYEDDQQQQGFGGEEGVDAPAYYEQNVEDIGAEPAYYEPIDVDYQQQAYQPKK